MYNVLKLNKISPVIDVVFDDKYSLTDGCENPDGIIVRSFNMAEYEVKEKLLAVARAGAGVNNIPIDKMSARGVVVFNTPGANANAVKELVLCGMLIASRDIIGGNRWVNNLTQDVAKATEKGKSQFGGTEISGKTLGVIGLGAIGVLVANAAVALGMKAVGYDPYLTDENRKKLCPDVEVLSLDEVYGRSDIITLHVPLLDATKGMIDKTALSKMKDGVIILNMARGALVKTEDLKTAISFGKVRKYVVDFPDEQTINSDGIIVLPHLGASTEEAEDNCAEMAAKQLKAYIEEGTIKNSVNFPAMEKPRNGKSRVCVLFSSEALSVVEQLPGDKKIALKGSYGYAIIDNATPVTIPDAEGILRVRTL